jgi:deoxyribose-phosphate aldolase
MIQMNIKQYLDSTYLKTASQANLTEEDNAAVVKSNILEAINEDFKLIMIRPEHVKMARKIIDEAKSNVVIGTVIDFPEGTSSVENKINEAEYAIKDGVDELDYVVNYEAFKKGDVHLIKDEVIACTRLGLLNHKIVKFIIEVAALTNDQIIQISSLIKNTVVSNFEEKVYQNVFVKSSTGFYKTKDGLPNGATVPTITLMLENSHPLPVKAAGGVRTLEEALEMINLGVKRIGTSAAKTIADGKTSKEGY